MKLYIVRTQKLKHISVSLRWGFVICQRSLVTSEQMEIIFVSFICKSPVNDEDSHIRIIRFTNQTCDKQTTRHMIASNSYKIWFDLFWKIAAIKTSFGEIKYSIFRTTPIFHFSNAFNGPLNIGFWIVMVKPVFHNSCEHKVGLYISCF